MIEERGDHSGLETKGKVALLFSGFKGRRCVKECEEFNFDDKKGKSLRDILTGVYCYGIGEKEGKANVFGGETNKGEINEIQVFCSEENR